MDGILTLGGTILRTSRTNVRKIEGGIEKCVANLKANKLDALIAIGGDDTQSVTNALIEAGVPGVGVPKTIDNDLNGDDGPLRPRAARSRRMFFARMSRRGPLCVLFTDAILRIVDFKATAFKVHSCANGLRWSGCRKHEPLEGSRAAWLCTSSGVFAGT